MDNEGRQYKMTGEITRDSILKSSDSLQMIVSVTKTLAHRLVLNQTMQNRVAHVPVFEPRRFAFFYSAVKADPVTYLPTHQQIRSVTQVIGSGRRDSHLIREIRRSQQGRNRPDGEHTTKS